MPSNLSRLFDDLKLEGEAKEKYEIIRRYRFGKDFNVVYKVYEKDNPKTNYVIKSYKTREEFERESQMLKELNGAKNITQMINFYPSKSIIVSECALYGLETFLGHQDYIQRHEEKGNIIKDIVSGLLELQKHDIVHTELAPKNIMYFQEKDGNTENWKLIDFDRACFVSTDNVKIKTNYSAPEVLRAYKEGTYIKASFEMDMFSFGLILYFLETGHHYWDGNNEEKEREIVSETIYLPLHDIADQTAACFVIKMLLDKNISHRMTLEGFMKTSFYTGKSEGDSIYGNSNNSTHNIQDYDLETTNIHKDNQDNYAKGELLYREKLTQESSRDFLEKYHNEMKLSLKMMNDKIDKYAKVLEDLSDLTKKIPQMLVKLKNEKVPRVFIMIPDQKDWKKPETWFSKPFRLLFVCEYKNQWHVPEQEGYKVLNVSQFIKKYGPWINLCLQTLCSVIRALTSNIFPESVAHILSSVFDINNSYNLKLIQYFQEIIDTVDISVKTMPDEEPDFVPLSNEIHTQYRMINASGLHQLEKFLDTQECASHFGGLIQCVDDKTQEVLWLCEEHSNEYKPVSSPLYSPKLLSPELRTTNISPSESTSPPTLYIEPITRKWDYSDFDKGKLISLLDPFYALEYVYKILCEVVMNAIGSERKHFRKDDIKKIAEEIHERMNNFKSLCKNWDNDSQKIQFIKILKNQAHLYIHYLILIVRYCVVKDVELLKQMKFLCADTIEISRIITAGKSFNKYLSKLISALNNNTPEIGRVLDNFDKEQDLDLKVNDDSIIVNYESLFRWYHVKNRTHNESLDTPSTGAQGEEILFEITKNRLDDDYLIIAKSLKHLSNENFLCMMKEIYFYSEHELNNDNIIEFRGYSIHDCRTTLFYEYTECDLSEYFHDPSANISKDWKEKIQIAWGISQGVRYLHDKDIIHLDLRSANILLKYDDGTGKIPIKSSSEEDLIWKRWYDPDRLSHGNNFESILPSSDIYSLGLLFWEIVWCKAENLPFGEIPIKNLYNHLRNNNYERLPEIPEEYKSWEKLIKRMWKFKSGDRCDIKTVESTMRKLHKGRTNSASSSSSFLTPISPTSYTYPLSNQSSQSD
ncbi:kinase-like domain-containing protein [Rhizophagus clarus]|uniref:non-specific serine/threonine protein kinase n=1 Tax=Rhizophagus clarus TaxID=94130 RepID=A0A8H3LET4_9GLOM|nr:kinase-like domain-containing protein [Rhizophagus clarus]